MPINGNCGCRIEPFHNNIALFQQVSGITIYTFVFLGVLLYRKQSDRLAFILASVILSAASYARIGLVVPVDVVMTVVLFTLFWARL